MADVDDNRAAAAGDNNAGAAGRQPGAAPPGAPQPARQPPPRAQQQAAAASSSGLLNRFRSALLSSLSFLLTLVVLGNAYLQRQQFYPSVVYITKSNPRWARERETLKAWSTCRLFQFAVLKATSQICSGKKWPS